MRAIDTLKLEHPEYFRGDTILNGPGYFTGLIRILDRDDDLCAFFDGDELAVKRTNDFSEQYKLHTSWQEIRRSYMGVCYPGVVPGSRRNPAPSPQGCNLPPSYEVTCDMLDSRVPRRGRDGDRPGAAGAARALRLHAQGAGHATGRS